jgi:hypothetical protein
MMFVQLKGPPKAVVDEKAALRLLEVPMGQRGGYMIGVLPCKDLLFLQRNQRFG